MKINKKKKRKNICFNLVKNVKANESICRTNVPNEMDGWYIKLQFVQTAHRQYIYLCVIRRNGRNGRETFSSVVKLTKKKLAISVKRAGKGRTDLINFECMLCLYAYMSTECNNDILL